MKKTIFTLAFLCLGILSAFSQQIEKFDMIDHIDFTLQKDAETVKTINLQQLDYNFISNTEDGDDKKNEHMDVSFSCYTKDAIDLFLLQWVGNKPGEWSGSIRIYVKNKVEPQYILKFKKAMLLYYNQSFTPDMDYQGIYFGAKLKGVEINTLEM